MTADELKTLTTSTLDALGAALDAGHSKTLMAFFQAMARFHRYSFHNVCLIVAQRPTATQVAGFQTWKSLGRFVRRGEKGIAICAPIVRLRRDVPGDDEERAVAGFRAAYVFDLAQTDGEPLPDVAQVVGDPANALERLRGAVQCAGITLSYADTLAGAFGQSRGGAIDVLRGLAPATEFVVLAHEYAHELLHQGGDRPVSRDTRELEAEAVACVIGEACGVESVRAARDYIHVYRGDREALSASFERIHRAVATILTGIEAESSRAA
jgi:antirestriction protein ArdC